MKRLLRFLCLMCLMTATALPVRATDLPVGYTELEYVNMQSGSYLLTDIVPTYDSKIEMDFQTTSLIAASTSFLGGRNGASPNGFVFGSTSSKRLSVSAFSSTAYSSGYVFTDNTRYKMVFNNKVFNLTSSGSTVATYTFSGTNANGAALAINGNNNSPSGIVGGNAQGIYLYSFKVWNAQGQLIADYVPAKYGNSVGVYDTVNDQFYTNQGTGTFTAGPIACPNGGTLVTYTSATGTVSQSGTPSPTNPIEPVFYKQGDMALRKLNDTYYDSYDATTGKITRRVGVKVLNGTETWDMPENWQGTYPAFRSKNAITNNAAVSAENSAVIYSSNFSAAPRSDANSSLVTDNTISVGSTGHTAHTLWIRTSAYTTVADFKTWLSQNPVTVYYPLGTPIEEDWNTEHGSSYCAVSIKIATTKYTEDAFAGLMTTLSEAITKVTNIVDTTVQQATEIGELAQTKQDRPDTDCPAGRKCLLIMGADNKPHWYLIQE